ncbi:TVP38/TMEM64 family protein [Aestuariirhabdus litorea]|uniref:TVP38/TMEM64 family membrane protein n=2 Tax=Aestuariirhabdus litorea TaxID=2528527 RepID=A0A3P3VPB5_9GAMM|nr:TVP38/TMEM64 family protein [Aestuariirhabdus litorea]RWW93661.1 TVP38/TMEM64 family protein [Endozoicomonadaceae bacterium GTF-13]
MLLLVILAFAIWGWLDHFGSASSWYHSGRILQLVRDAGPTGPLIIVATMAIAIVFSPLPSAPIAMVSGALYGHLAGTLYIFIGSLVGASIAFTIARVLGYQAAQQWIEQRFPQWKLGDQRRLMWLVMASRLVPFVSFDLVSYAAGITALSYPRFLLATAIGILPASFLLAHFGEAAMEHQFAISLILLAVLLIAAGLSQLRSRTPDD